MTKFRRMYLGVLGLTVVATFSGLQLPALVALAMTLQGSTPPSRFVPEVYLGAPNSIQVRTIKHVVYLSGEVSTGLMSRTAEEIARGTRRVELVVNSISVTK